MPRRFVRTFTLASTLSHLHHPLPSTPRIPIIVKIKEFSCAHYVPQACAECVASVPSPSAWLTRTPTHQLDLLLHHGGQILGDAVLQRARRLVKE